MASSEPTLANALRQIRDDLDAAAITYAVVGGLAVSTRAEPRLTGDVDLAVAVHNDQEAEAIINRLIVRGYHVESTVEQTKTGRLATVRLRRTEDSPVVDLLFATCGIEPEIVAAAEALEVLPGLTLRVARTGHLIAMKLLSRDRNRPQDHDDARALLAVASQAERRRARAALALISKRGFGRGRDLDQQWKRLIKGT